MAENGYMRGCQGDTCGDNCDARNIQISLGNVIIDFVNQANGRLREAREQLPSPQTSGEQLSRHELAELINEWIYRQTGDVVALDANYIGKLERGRIRWPCKLYRDAFRAVLGVESDGQLGFSGRRRTSATVMDVDRQQFIRTAGAAVTLPWLDLFAPTTPTPVPNKVRLTEIEQIRSTAKVFSSWDNTHGGGLAREAVFAQLRWSARLLNADCESSLAAPLFAAVAELGEVAGFMAFDAYAHEDGRRAFRFALACAEQAKDWQLRANVLAGLARQAIWLNDPDDGLTFVELALVRPDRLTATERAMLHTVRARALAKMHRVQECLAAVGAADEAFTHSKPADDPPWMSFYDHAQHHGDTGHALFDLAVHGRKNQAAQRLAYSVAHHGPTFARSRAISRTKLASLLMATGDPRQAASIGMAALGSVGSLRSKRATDDLRELHRFAGKHGQIGEAHELHDCISEVLADR